MKRKLFTYEIYEDKVDKDSKIGWRKTAKEACDFASIIMTGRHVETLIIKSRPRKSSDFNY